MKSTRKFLIFALVAIMLFSLVGCFKQEGTIGAVVDKSWVGKITLSLGDPDSEQYTVDGATKDAVFTFVLNNQKLTEDKERIDTVRKHIESLDNPVYVGLQTNDGDDIVIMVDKDTGDFVIAYVITYGNTTGIIYDYRYASPEGEGFDIEAIMELVEEYK